MEIDNKCIHPNAPAGGCGFGNSTQAEPYGFNYSTSGPPNFVQLSIHQCTIFGDWSTSMYPVPNPAVGLNATQLPDLPQAIDNDTKNLAAVAYGEGSVKNVFEEMAAIANVLVRQQKARGYANISAFISADKTYAFAAHDGNQRYTQLISSKDADILKDTGMNKAILAAKNALDAKGTDYSNGAYFWDGADIKTNFSNHPKVKVGIHFIQKTHDIYSIGDKKVPDEAWWLDKDGKKAKLRGKWDYVYQSTAAFGGTIFWEYNPKYIAATGNKVYN